MKTAILKSLSVFIQNMCESNGVVIQTKVINGRAVAIFKDREDGKEYLLINGKQIE